jgi:predicted ATPase with chaperone activity
VILENLYVRPRHYHQMPEAVPSRILDRIDIRIEIPSVDYEKLRGDCLGVISVSICARGWAARGTQKKHFSKTGSDL